MGAAAAVAKGLLGSDVDGNVEGEFGPVDKPFASVAILLSLLLFWRRKQDALVDEDGREGGRDAQGIRADGSGRTI